MRCENCGAPLAASSTKREGCPYCGSAVNPKSNANSIGSMVDQLLEDMGTDAADPSTLRSSRNVHVVGQTTVSVNGQRYDNFEQLPPELKRAVNHGIAIARQMGQRSVGQTVTTVTVDGADDARTKEVPAPRHANRLLLLGILILIALVLAVAFAGAL
ncbi:MAG: hypothetical protein QM784_08765 [Polyangiaceae bacterium]